MIDEKNRGKGRGRSLIKLQPLLGVYANAEKVLLAHAPSNKRSQREDVIAAIAAGRRAIGPRGTLLGDQRTIALVLQKRVTQYMEVVNIQVAKIRKLVPGRRRAIGGCRGTP